MKSALLATFLIFLTSSTSIAQQTNKEQKQKATEAITIK
jgi:hypothetical protein